MSEEPTYEQAREELVDVVRRLESGGTTLEDSLGLWERGRSSPGSASSGWTAPVSGWTRRWPGDGDDGDDEG